MTEAETKAKKDGAADEESIMSESTGSETLQAEASAPVMGPCVPEKEAAGSDASFEPSASVLVNVAEQAPISTITLEGMGPKEEEGGKEVVVKRGKGNTPGKNAKRRKKKVAGNTVNAQPSRSVLVTVEEQASAIMIVDSEDKRSEGGDDECGKEEDVLDEGIKEGDLRTPASGTQKREDAAAAENAKDKSKERMDVADKVEASLNKEEEEKKDMPDEGKKATTLSRKAKRLRKRKTAALAVATTSAAVPAATDKDNDGKEEGADNDKVDSALRKRNKKKNKGNKARATAAEAARAAEVGTVKKPAAAKECAGMIFMCSAETKKDCYRYKIFGMPAGKKETVAKVYKGMKLFLYDIDLKLLYGIYKAASKGGYNIQPKAFKSAFPSQVRFKVLKDYLPLPEEKFKAAIKENYYRKKKFNLELSAEQVQKLSRLFVEATKASKLTNGRATRERVPHDRKRERFHGTVSRPLIEEAGRVIPRTRDRYGRDGYASKPPLPVPFPHGPGVPLQAPFPPYSSPPQLVSLPPPPPAYAYERPRDVDYYHRELTRDADYYQREPPRDVDYYRRELPMDTHDYRVIDSEMPLPFNHVGRNDQYNDPYSLHREPAPYQEIRYPTLPSGYHAPPPPPYRY